MNYEKQKESKFNHYIVCDGEPVVLMGVNKTLSEEGIRLLAKSPMFVYPDGYLDTYFKLSGKNRGIVNAVYEKMMDSKSCINYWDAVTDFIFACYGQTLYDISCDLAGYTTYGEQAERKLIYDRLDKLRKVKGKPRKETLDTIREVWAYYLLTDDIVKTGTGMMYFVSDSVSREEINEKYTLETIREVWGRDADKKLKDVILELMELEEEQLREVPVKVAYHTNKLDAKAREHIMLFMEELYQNQ